VIVATAPCDVGAVYDYRTLFPARALAAQGEIQHIEAEEPVLNYAVRRHGEDEPVGIVNLPDCDVFVLTRVLAGPIARAIPLIRREGIAVVVDIDDDFRHTPPGMGGREKIQPSINPEYNWRHLAEACAAADMVTCSTPALTPYAPHGRVQILRNCVPTHYLEITGTRDGKTVGWSGSNLMHPGDLRVTRGGVAKAVSEFSADFMVVGERQGVREALGLEHEPFATGPVSHQTYIRKLAELDAGIAPLSDNRYTRAKSALKLLQYSALGIPWVASPSPEQERLYEEMASEGSLEPAGALAAPRSREWHREVLKALRMAQNAPERIYGAMQFVASRYTVEKNAWRWAEAWEAALEYRRR
jgi:hypothetical protein